MNLFATGCWRENNSRHKSLIAKNGGCMIFQSWVSGTNLYSVIHVWLFFFHHNPRAKNSSIDLRFFQWIAFSTVIIEFEKNLTLCFLDYIWTNNSTNFPRSSSRVSTRSISLYVSDSCGCTHAPSGMDSTSDRWITGGIRSANKPCSLTIWTSLCWWSNRTAAASARKFLCGNLRGSSEPSFSHTFFPLSSSSSPPVESAWRGFCSKPEKLERTSRWNIVQWSANISFLLSTDLWITRFSKKNDDDESAKWLKNVLTTPSSLLALARHRIRAHWRVKFESAVENMELPREVEELCPDEGWNLSIL